MSEKYVAEYVEIIDGHGERKGVCVTDTEHTVSFEVKDEIVAMELCDLLNKLYEENERLRNQLERKTILLKIRTKHIDDREKSFHELLNYLESFCYKSNIDGNYAKQDIINILNNWEIREYD